MFKTPNIILIGILVAIILLQRWCSGGDPCPDAVVTTDTIVTPGDTIFRNIITEKPIPHEKIITRWQRVDIDTGAILIDYFAKYFYTDTIKDSTMVVVVDDTITENKISSRQVSLKNLRPIRTVINTTVVDTCPGASRKLYLGGSIGGNDEAFNCGPEVLYQTRKDALYGYHYDFVNKTHNFKTFWKVSLRKKKRSR